MRVGCFHQTLTNVSAIVIFLWVETCLRIWKKKTRVQPFKVTDVITKLKVTLISCTPLPHPALLKIQYARKTQGRQEPNENFGSGIQEANQASLSPTERFRNIQSMIRFTLSPIFNRRAIHDFFPGIHYKIGIQKNKLRFLI